MNRTLLASTAIIAILLVLVGLAGLDRPLMHAIHDSGFESAAVFTQGLGALDAVVGLHVSYWLAPCVVTAVGLLILIVSIRVRGWAQLGRVLFISGLVQVATIGSMMLGKNTFGRVRPAQLLEAPDTSPLWFVGGGSFPSGHCAFYFGLLLPLAAFLPRAWQRAALMLVPTYVALARMDMNRHFLSDVGASIFLAALFGLVAAACLRQWQARADANGVAVSPLAAATDRIG